jgi:hypothetical protein
MILAESLSNPYFSLLETCIRVDVVWFQIFDKSEGPVCFPKAGFSLIYQQRLGQPMNPGLVGNDFLIHVR